MAKEHFLTQAPIIAMQSGWPSLWLADPGTGKTQSFYSVARFFHAVSYTHLTLPTIYSV